MPGPIEIVASDPRWPQWFHEESVLVRAAIGTSLLGLEHVGSTSVPGLGAKPTIDMAAFYPDTSIALNDEVVRYLYASAYLSRVEAMRSITDFDYASEQMILDGALDRFKVLLFLWGSTTEKPVL